MSGIGKKRAESCPPSWANLEAIVLSARRGDVVRRTLGCPRSGRPSTSTQCENETAM